MNADDPSILSLTQGELLGANLFAYCFNNPVNNADHSGMVVTPANVIGAIIGVVLGAVGGYFLSRFLADKLGLKDWKRTVFIAGITAVISAAAGVIGYFIGPYVAKVANSIMSSLKGLFTPKIGTQIGKLGKVVKNTKPLIKGLTKHGSQRMIQRGGVTEALAQQIVTNGFAISQVGGKVLYFTKSGVVVLNAAGSIVTTYSAQYFDEAMQAIIKLFFG